MLKGATAAAHGIYGEKCQLGFACPGFGKVGKPAPSTTWRMRDYRQRAGIIPGVAVDVPDVTTG